jgi:hypothetical protein
MAGDDNLIVDEVEHGKKKDKKFSMLKIERNEDDTVQAVNCCARKWI